MAKAKSSSRKGKNSPSSEKNTPIPDRKAGKGAGTSETPETAPGSPVTEIEEAVQAAPVPHNQEHALSEIPEEAQVPGTTTPEETEQAVTGAVAPGREHQATANEPEIPPSNGPLAMAGSVERPGNVPLEDPLSPIPAALPALLPDPSKTTPVVLPQTKSPVGESARLAPRASKSDSFEQNPLTSIPADIPEALPLSEAIPSAVIPKAKRAAMDDVSRVREAVRQVVEHGDSVKTAGREWKVAPSSIAEWRARYRDLLEQTPTPLIELDSQSRNSSQVYIPEIAREMFTENWDRLVTKTATDRTRFRQRKSQVFLQTSPLTSWLFSDGELDRGILAGAASALIGIAIVTSFLVADRNIMAPAPPPEPAPRDDLLIDQAEVVARAFLAAGNWQERLKLVRQPETVQGMMEAYYKDNPDGPINDAILSMAMPTGHTINLSFDIPSRNRSHFLCLVNSGGKYLVDWESSSLYQESWLGKLRSTRPTVPTRIAVTATKEDASYFNYAFRDSGKWECYKLGYPGLAMNLFGYALKESADAISLDAILSIVDRQPVVLEVRFPGIDAKDNQVEIIRILRTEWVPESLPEG